MNHARMWTALRRTLALEDALLATLGPERARKRLAAVGRAGRRTGTGADSARA